MGSTPLAVSAGDFNADGKADIVTANNGSNSVSILLNTSADLTPPTTTTDYDGLWHKSALTVHLSATDNAGGSGMVGGLAKTEYSKDGGATWTTGTAVSYGMWKRGGGSGVYTLLYRSTDAAGNIEGTRSIEVKIDARPPTTSNDAPLTPRTGSVTVHLTGIDSLFGVSACSGLAATFYRLDTGGWTPGSAVTVSGLGLHWICYYSTDNAGNAENAKWCSVTIVASAKALRRPARSPSWSLAAGR